MEYEVQTTKFDKLLIGGQGVVEPLCNSCACPDCSNPIREQSVSVFGQTKKFRLFVVNNVARQVVQCKGYVGDQDVGFPKTNI